MNQLTTEQVYPVSNSRLSAFKRSPKHLLHYLINRPEPTNAMAFGSAFHAFLLQPEIFDSIYAVAPEVDRRTKDGKAAFEAFSYLAAEEGKTIISSFDLYKIEQMASSVMANPIASELIKSATAMEKTVEWTNEETGIPMKGIIDGIGTEYMFDVKTCADADPGKFARDAYYSNYHRQAAIYMDSHSDKKMTDFYFIAVEKEEPYGVSVHRCSEYILELGKKQYLDAIIEYRSWVDGGMPDAGYEYWHYSGIHELDTPNK
jgi:hypothetical protein